MNTAQLVVVEWSDAWVRAEECISMADVHGSHKPMLVTTIGWLLLDDDIGISLANEYYEEGTTYRGRSFIMRSMVMSVTPYNAAKAPRRRRPRAVAQTPEPQLAKVVPHGGA